MFQDLEEILIWICISKLFGVTFSMVYWRSFEVSRRHANHAVKMRKHCSLRKRAKFISREDPGTRQTFSKPYHNWRLFKYSVTVLGQEPHPCHDKNATSEVTDVFLFCTGSDTSLFIQFNKNTIRFGQKFTGKLNVLSTSEAITLKQAVFSWQKLPSWGCNWLIKLQDYQETGPR